VNKFSLWLVKQLVQKRGERRDYTGPELTRAFWQTFNSEPGKIVLYNLTMNNFFAMSFRAGNKCCDTAFLEGRRSLCQEIFDHIDAYHKVTPYDDGTPIIETQE